MVTDLRLRAKLQEVEMELAAPAVIPDADRVALLLSTGASEVLTEGEIEQRDAHHRRLTAIRTQLEADASAVEQEIARSSARAGAASLELATARDQLGREFGHLVHSRYLAELQDFVVRWHKLLFLAGKAGSAECGASLGHLRNLHFCDDQGKAANATLRFGAIPSSLSENSSARARAIAAFAAETGELHVNE